MRLKCTEVNTQFKDFQEIFNNKWTSNFFLTFNNRSQTTSEIEENSKTPDIFIANKNTL